jgi:hypothetical protein
MPFFRSPLADLLAGILFAGTGAAQPAAIRTPRRRSEEAQEPASTLDPASPLG